MSCFDNTKINSNGHTHSGSIERTSLPDRKDHEKARRLLQISIVVVTALILMACMSAFVYGVIKSNMEYDLGIRCLTRYDLLAVSALLGMVPLGIVAGMALVFLEKKNDKQRQQM